MAWRFEPAPEARTRATLTPTASFGKRPPRRAQRPAGQQRVDRRQHLLGAQVAVGAVVRQPVVGVLLDHLRPPAAQDLHAARAADRRAGRCATTSRIAPVEVEPPPAAAAAPLARRRARRRRRGTERRIADVAARPVGRGRRAVAEVAQDALAPAAACPRPTPTPRGTGASGRACPPAAAGGRPRARVRSHAPTTPARHAIGRRGRRLDHPRARHVADDRAHRLLLALVRASSLMCRL